MRINLAISCAAVAAAFAAAPAAAQQELLWSADGRIDEADRQDQDQHRFEEHRVRLEAGQRYRLSASSEDFDTVLVLFAAGGGEPLAENDDSGGALNSRINYTAASTGEYVLRVRTFSPDGRGGYSVAAETVPPLPPPVSSPGMAVPASGTWSLWQGELAPSDPDADGRRYDDYLVRFEAGQTRYISLEAEAFDATVQLLTAAGRDRDPPETVDGDDDAGAGFNSLMAFRAEEAGDYVVRVGAYGQDAAGPYRLWISQ
jgi:hypothetical protein